jgi:nitrous oxide reductase
MEKNIKKCQRLKAKGQWLIYKLNTMKKKSDWIMDCDTEELLKIIAESLAKIEDAQQVVSEMDKPKVLDYLTDSQVKLDKLYHQFKLEGKASQWDRNQARKIIKETNKVIVVDVSIPYDYV